MRLSTMGDNTKQVRVDNWGIFFLQRLQMFFSKTDYCDMTLQFEGNVQLKVHRLVMNACTEYFQYLEQTCTLEDNVIMMPSDLQADVIVPIVNFMYTGMLEFQLSIFDKLYKTAQVMNITILTKLLDAQKQSVSPAIKSIKKKHIDLPQAQNTPVRKSPPKPVSHPDLPAPLPGRKIPVWKRKSIPAPLQPHSHGSSQVSYAPEPKWSAPIDPLSIPDNTPKPTRFEWPDDDLPPLNPMDTSFEEISYTSKPLLTQEEEQRATANFDDLRHIPNATRSSTSSKKQSSPSLDMEEMKNYVKEQKIRSGLSQDEEMVDDLDVVVDSGQKRKAVDQKGKAIVKKVRFDEPETKTTTISIATDGKSGTDLNHEKIVAEILKKYPQLVKKNKNIRLKIMAKNNKAPLESSKVENVHLRAPRLKVAEIQKTDSPKHLKSHTIESKPEGKAPWICDRCSTEDELVEFVLYYLYRKHMTDVHGEKFDSKLCKYCGHRCNKHNLLMYHLYTKHGLKPRPGYNFPKCDQCPFIALSANLLSKHKSRHGKNEIQCTECKLAFTSQVTLTSHIQITGHTGKSNKNNYDCQYCTKKFQSGVNLFSHVRLQHKNEGLRDGIVSIDEMDDIEEFDEEETKDEYILPEIITDPEPRPTKKVNILSNVKVQDRQEHRHQQLTLEPSSEAEALNNVATGIATSLGLVDIVVLNDNQQIFLQSNQQNFTNDQNEQPEFILPELTGRDSFAQTQNEVITTDGVITQSMLSSGDIGSTDELVMVLTDHDYGDNQEEINNDNSNIVVLYSHPVDGQQDQFITSQGNIMVNSQGLIEIRNGATITSTANQVVMPQETHIESIEMIQREIESHQELKQEALFEEEKPEVLKEKEDETVATKSDPLIESLTQGEQLEFTSPLVPAATEEEEEEREPEPREEEEEEEREAEPREEEEEEREAEPREEEEEEREPERRGEEEEEERKPKPREDEEENRKVAEVEESREEQQPVATEEQEEEEGTNVEAEPLEAVEVEKEDNGPVEEETQSFAEESKEAADAEEATLPASTEEKEKEAGSAPMEESSTSVEEPPTSNEEAQPTTEEGGDYSFHVPDDEDETINKENETESKENEEVENQEEEVGNKEEEESENREETPPSVDDTEKEIPVSDDKKNDNPELMEIDEEEENKNVEETNVEQETSQSDTSTSQFNDENSQSSQDSHNKENAQENVSTKISLLDDWEDTDSQQSDKEKKVAGETVHKLMDDWEEEEEDDKKEVAE